ncbi:hypothetical protein QCA50_003966 [Cerrena zonata]|uniref:Uncharacterized protein n=1 Tax=Cerrena zonata TaxID=2478898 RepID=A0AAW0GS20_9APHY
MMSSYKVFGNTIYGLLLASTVADGTIALFFVFFNNDTGFSDGLFSSASSSSPCTNDPDSWSAVAFGLANAVLGYLTWIWVVVLMVYFNRPKSVHHLCRVRSHTISHAVFGLGYAVITIGIVTTRRAKELGIKNNVASLWTAQPY